MLASAWGLAGAAALLVRAIWSLARAGAHAFHASSGALASWQWGLLAAWTGAMCFFQGYLGLQRGFSSRVVARAFYLASQREPRLLDLVLAPLFCIGLVGASRRRQRTTLAVVSTMVLLVVAVSRVPQPYRGLIDIGVAAGLAWGLVALGVFAVRALLGHLPAVSLDLPAENRAAPAPEQLAEAAVQ
jgi:hypothetical protein